MPYRSLGQTGMQVSSLCLGAMMFGGFGNRDHDECVRIIHRALDAGINFIDTADVYSAGESEEIVGKALSGGRRDDVILATKCHFPVATGPFDPNRKPNTYGSSRRHIIRSCEDSLRRLGTDYIDRYYLHMWDFRTPGDEILRAFDDLVRAGKILYIGISDTPAWQIARMQMMAELRGWSQFCSLQVSYSLIERTVERELIPMARETGLGVCPWSPLGGGVLSGKYTVADLAGDAGPMTSRKAINVATGRLSDRSLAIAQAVGEVAAELGRTPPQVALAWTLRDRAIVSPVLGARTPAQLEDNLGALGVEFTTDQLERLEKVSAVPLGFPHEMLAAPTNAGAFGNVSVEKR